MKYKVGDEIMLRNDLVPGERYGAVIFYEFMSKLIAVKQKIKAVNADPKGYCYEVTYWYISEEMIDHDATAKLNESICKYPGLKAAIMAKKDMKIRVTPEQSVEVQKIAFECGTRCGESSIKEIIKTQEKYLYIGTGYIQYDRKEEYFNEHFFPEFSLEHDCFMSEIPSENVEDTKDKWLKAIEPGGFTTLFTHQNVTDILQENGYLDDNESVDKDEKKSTTHCNDTFNIYEIINAEVKRAESLRPVFPADLVYQSALLEKESGEVIKEILHHLDNDKASLDDFYMEVIHTAAVAVRILKNRSK